MHEHDGALAARPVSEIRRWCEDRLVVGDGPLAGARYRVGGGGQGRAPIPAWRDVLDSMDDPEVEQSTIRGSVQSGKTASLIAAALYHLSRGRSVLIFEPDDRLKRTLAARIVAWGRLCEDEAIQAAYTPKRPPFVRTTSAGGRLEVISAKEGGAGLMRTAEVVIVDELRVFHADLLGDLIDRMAAYGGRGRLITASSAGYENECRTTVELDKSDARRWFMSLPVVRPPEHRRLEERDLQEPRESRLLHAVLWRGAGGRAVPSRRHGRPVEADQGRRWCRHGGLSPRCVPVAVRVSGDHRAPVEARRRSPKTDRQAWRR